MPSLLLFQPDARAQARLAEALGDQYRLLNLKEPGRLERVLRRQPLVGCVLDIFHPTSPIPLTILRRIRRRHPSLAIVVHSDFAGREMELYNLGRISVDGVIRAEEEGSPRTIRAIVARALSAALAATVVRAIEDEAPPLGQECIRWAIEHAENPTPVAELALAMGISHRALLRELRSMELPPPSQLLLWGRLLAAAHLLELPGSTVESVAYRLGYSTGGALRKALKRHVGCTPTALLRRGGLSWTLDLFRQKGLRPRQTRRVRWTSPKAPLWSMGVPRR